MLSSCAATPARVGAKAPDFSLPRLSGSGRLGPADYRGSWVVLIFWAQWCGPCRSEQPSLDRLASEAGGRVDFLGIDYNDDQAAAEAYVREASVPYPSVFDQAGQTLSLYAVPTIPYVVVISPEGDVRFRFEGEIGGPRLQRQLASLGALKSGEPVR